MSHNAVQFNPFTHDGDEPPKLEVLYQDEYLVAINKPAGLFVHRTMLDKGEKYFAVQLLRDQIGQYVYPIHRLDRPTSGVLLFGLNEEVTRQLNLAFEQREIEKTYYALTRGFFQQDGELDYPLKEKLDKIADKDAQQDKEAQAAVTNFRSIAHASLNVPLGKFDSVRYSLVECSPKTGRKHQIRRHLSHLRHPIIGDINYGDNKQNPFFGEQFGFRRLMLMAQKLSFVHPVSQEMLTISTKFDAQWLTVLEKLGIAATALED